MASAYSRLRLEARALTEREGWGSGEDFDMQLPPLPNPTPPAYS
jgi:hypothetical protein